VVQFEDLFERQPESGVALNLPTQPRDDVSVVPTPVNEVCCGLVWYVWM